MVLLNLLPFMAGVAIAILIIVRVKKGYRPKEFRLKKMGLTLLFWIAVALVLVAVLNLMQDARH